MIFFNILDIVNTAIEKLTTILDPGRSRADYLLEYSINSDIFIICILFEIFVDNKLKKVGIKKVSLVKILIYLTSSLSQKLVPGLK